MLGKCWLWLLFITYLGFSMPAISRLLVSPLLWEHSPLKTAIDAQGAQAIIVLDGGTVRFRQDNEISLELPDGDTVLRGMEAARVYRLLEEPLVFISGGTRAIESHWSPEASALREVLIKVGVPSDRIILDSNSINTRMHAVNLSKMLKERGITSFVLVTSPIHMRRSVLSFRAVGVDPIPSSSKTLLDDKTGWKAYWPTPKSLLFTEQMMHDYIGLVYYRLSGWI